MNEVASEKKWFTFTFMHLADAFIQSDLQYIIHGYTFFFFFLSVCVFPGNWTHNLCADNAMLYHWATGTKKGFNKKNII